MEAEADLAEIVSPEFGVKQTVPVHLRCQK